MCRKPSPSTSAGRKPSDIARSEKRAARSAQPAARTRTRASPRPRAEGRIARTIPGTASGREWAPGKAARRRLGGEDGFAGAARERAREHVAQLRRIAGPGLLGLDQRDEL